MPLVNVIAVKVEAAREHPEGSVTVIVVPEALAVPVPGEHPKAPPSVKAGADARMKPAGKVTVTVSPATRAPP